MIMSGWILPDYTKVRCRSYANNKEHIQIVEKYLKNIQISEPHIYQEIVTASEKLNIPKDALDDIAVKVLGWTKVNNEPMKLIFYLSGFLFENIIIRYINLGYTIVPIYHSPVIRIPNPSLYL